MTLKTKAKRGIRQQVGLLAYFFPSFFASGFDLEALLPLEQAGSRLEDLTRVRMSKSVPLGEKFWMTVLSDDRTGGPTTISTAPIAVTFEPADADTLRYRLNLHDDLFQINVRGTLKRWEQNSTVVLGKIQFDLHYTGILIKSFLWLVAALVAGGFVFLALRYRLNAAWMLYEVARLEALPALLLVAWLLALAAVWVNDVVSPANARRYQLVTRIEDTLLFPGIVGK
ncbi:MAG: hypothetical protein HZC41_11720 [Chloroflexi bacterium]|nr:hypothetical protein [Chloroflexota bacterium]